MSGRFWCLPQSWNWKRAVAATCALQNSRRCIKKCSGFTKFLLTPAEVGTCGSRGLYVAAPRRAFVTVSGFTRCASQRGSSNHAWSRWKPYTLNLYKKGAILCVSSCIGACLVGYALTKRYMHLNLFSSALSDSVPSLHDEVLRPSPITTDSLSPGKRAKEFSILEQCRLLLRLLYLTALFLPVAWLYGISYLFGVHCFSDLGWWYLSGVVQMAGPTFIKLSQWASSRRDLFSERFCSALTCLQTKCSPHSWEDTVSILEENLGPDWDKTILIEDRDPIGSGCVAQVYKGYLLRTDSDDININSTAPHKRSDSHSEFSSVNLKDESLTGSSSEGSFREHAHAHLHPAAADLEKPGLLPLAIKVMHPGVAQSMERDLELMYFVTGWADYLVPDLHWVALKECTALFCSSMEQQLDLSLEAINLRKFQSLLEDYPTELRFPMPIYPLVTPQVLVETFEEGVHISKYMSEPGGALQCILARVGVEVLLDMLFVHNFVHGDLHPGNILVQEQEAGTTPCLVLLDCGLATSLTQKDLEDFRKTFIMIVKNKGSDIADLFLRDRHCPTLQEYRQDMDKLVDGALKDLSLNKITIGSLFNDLFDIMVRHKVQIEPNYTSIMLAMSVVEGLGRSLDPNLNLLAIATPRLLQMAAQEVRERVTEKTAGWWARAVEAWREWRLSLPCKRN